MVAIDNNAAVAISRAAVRANYELGMLLVFLTRSPKKYPYLVLQNVEI